jgi:hypothetical protein
MKKNTVIHHKADALFLVDDANSDNSEVPVSSLDTKGNVYWVKLPDKHIPSF